MKKGDKVLVRLDLECKTYDVSNGYTIEVNMLMQNFRGKFLTVKEIDRYWTNLVGAPIFSVEENNFLWCESLLQENKRNVIICYLKEKGREYEVQDRTISTDMFTFEW